MVGEHSFAGRGREILQKGGFNKETISNLLAKTEVVKEDQGENKPGASKNTEISSGPRAGHSPGARPASSATLLKL